MSVDEGMPPRRPVRWLRVALVVSLGLNLLMVGLAAGRALRPDMLGPAAVVLRDLNLGAYTEALGPEDRAALRAAFAERAPPLREAWRTHRAEQAALVAALRAEPFAAEAVAAMFEAQNRRLGERAALARAMLVERIAAMDRAERRAFADRLEAAFAHGPGGAHGHERAGGDGEERPPRR
ncbi:MAG: periplasmic heavy metal sensor [Rhodobacteraceae bacterium]|jgi:uncharacterized membrane protein|nr:periplasmic heavy metal sensor [Paracoccaceae bacterium]